MKTFYYSFSAELRKTLEDIEAIRTSLLLHPLSPRKQLEFQFEALVERLYYHELLQNQHISRESIVSLFYPQPKLRVSKEDQRILNYKKALDYITFDWLASAEVVDMKTISLLASTLQIPPASFERVQDDITQGLQYIQVHPESPLTQAAVAHMIIEDLLPQYSRSLPYLVSLLFLYKGGYDFKGLLILEKYLFQDKETYSSIAREGLKTNNLSTWIEFFAKKMLENAKDMTEMVTHQSKLTTIPSSMFELTERQKDILKFLQKPGVTITNRKVQELYRVSQITASRDLAKLTSLGLLFSIGAGHSTYYTRV